MARHAHEGALDMFKFGDALRNQITVLVLAQNPDEHGFACEGGYVARNIRRSAEHEFFGLKMQDRDGGFWRQALDAPGNEPVEHDVAEDQDAFVAPARNVRLGGSAQHGFSLQPTDEASA
jgi:hypothetical protein